MDTEKETIHDLADFMDHHWKGPCMNDVTMNFDFLPPTPNHGKSIEKMLIIFKKAFHWIFFSQHIDTFYGNSNVGLLFTQTTHIEGSGVNKFKKFSLQYEMGQNLRLLSRRIRPLTIKQIFLNRIRPPIPLNKDVIYARFPNRFTLRCTQFERMKKEYANFYVTLTAIWVLVQVAMFQVRILLWDWEDVRLLYRIGGCQEIP